MSVVDFGFEPGLWDPPAPEPVRPRRNVRAVLRRWLAVLTLVAAVCCGGWLAVQQYETHVAADQALAAAESYVLRLTDLDADNLDQNFSDMAQGATGELQGRHAKSGAKLRKLLAEHQVHAHGHITESVVKSASKNHVVVVLLVNQAVTSKVNQEPVIDRSRIRLTMDKTDGRWLASKMELL